MRIISLTADNLRCLPPIRIAVERHLVVVGRNDAGKSSLLRALNAVLGVTPSQLGGVFQLRDFADPDQPIRIEVVLGHLTSEEEAAFADEWDLDSRTLSLRLEATVDPLDDAVLVERTFPGFESRRVSVEKLRLLRWRYVPATRGLERDVGGQRGGALWSLLGDIDLDDPVELREALAAYREALDGIGALQDLRREVAGALDGTLPFEVTTDDVLLRASGDLEDRPLRDVTLAIRRDNDTQGFDEQSDGIRALAALALHSVANAGASIVAIDEPELHLHPPAQRHLGHTFANSAVQHVIATNSPHVLAQFSAADVLAISPLHHARKLPAGSPARAFEFAARWWAEPVIEPLTAERLVVLEGVTDQLVFRAVVAALGLSLDRKSVATLNLAGASSFGNIVHIYGPNGFGVPMFGMVDADNQDDWAKRLGVTVAELNNHGIQVCDPDLEGVIAASLGSNRTTQLLVDSGLFSAAQIASACGVSTVSSVSDAALTAWVRRPNVKKDVAIAVAHGLTQADAQLLAPIRLLAQAATS